MSPSPFQIPLSAASGIILRRRAQPLNPLRAAASTALPDALDTPARRTTLSEVSQTTGWLLARGVKREKNFSTVIEEIWRVRCFE